LGPLLGSYLSAEVGFRFTQDTVALINLAYAFLYFILADGKEAFKSLKQSEYDKLIIERDLRLSLNSSSINLNK
jgi:hypothetical protein